MYVAHVQRSPCLRAIVISLGRFHLIVSSLQSEQGAESSFEIPIHVSVDERITPRVDLGTKQIYNDYVDIG